MVIFSFCISVSWALLKKVLVFQYAALFSGTVWLKEWSDEVFLHIQMFWLFEQTQRYLSSVVMSYHSTKHSVGSQNLKETTPAIRFCLWDTFPPLNKIKENEKILLLSNLRMLLPIEMPINFKPLFDILTYMMAINPAWQWFWKVTCGYCFSWC